MQDEPSKQVSPEASNNPAFVVGDTVPHRAEREKNNALMVIIAVGVVAIVAIGLAGLFIAGNSTQTPPVTEEDPEQLEFNIRTRPVSEPVSGTVSYPNSNAVPFPIPLPF